MIELIDEKLAFVGSGIIAGIWMERLISSGVVAPDQIMACDPRADRLQELQNRFDVRTSSKNVEGASFARVVAIATPPSEVLPVVKEIGSSLRAEKIVVSLAAGVSLSELEQKLGSVPVVRVMPNTPSLVGEAMNLVVYGRRMSAEARERMERILNVFGRWFEVADDQMDCWCALCAVGPTYILPVIEALAYSASIRGIPPERALMATAQVVAGAARMVQRTKKSPSELKQMVGLRTLREEDAKLLFADAYNEAVNKLQSMARRLAA